MSIILKMYLFIFLFGTMIGSFINVLVYRLPRGINIFLPRSFCPGCNKTVVWYENIPLISYLFLRGKCSKCSFKIPLRYPFIELILGIVAIFLFPSNLNSESLLHFVMMFSTACVFTAMFFIDLKFKIIPNGLNIYLAILYLVYGVIHLPLNHWLFGGLLGVGFPLAITWIFYLIRGEVGLGGGDIKLFGVLGMYLGPIGLIYNIFLSCFLGSVVGLSLMAMKKMDRKNPLPFGPFIILVASVQMFFPESFKTFLSYIR